MTYNRRKFLTQTCGGVGGLALMQLLNTDGQLPVSSGCVELPRLSCLLEVVHCETFGYILRDRSRHFRPVHTSPNHSWKDIEWPSRR
jgi:hypothetical protein